MGDPTAVFGAGCRGQGSLTVADGLAVRSTEGYLGYHPGSSGMATINGTGSAWNNSSDLYVGYYGTGTLNIENGGAVSSAGHAYLGYDMGSTGTATITGIGSTWTTSSDLVVGYDGSGTLNIDNGGAVYSNGGVFGVGGTSGTATVSGADSTWANSSYLVLGGDNGSGTLNIHNGGAVTVSTDLTISSLSTLDILLASTSDPLLDVDGNANLYNGTLSVGLADGFVLSQGDLFTLIDMTDISKTVNGTFSGLAEGAIVGNFDGLDLFISYEGGDGNDVTLFTLLSGDFDGDGDVDGVDFGLWQTGYPTASGALLSDGDADGDGDVDGTDFGIWQANYPTNLGGSAAIPEPATLGLILLGGLALANRRRK